MPETQLEPQQKLQESEYSFPYHYIPEWSDGTFSQTCHWSWGFRYLGGIQVVLDLLGREEFEALVDIGCGDGRFLGEAAQRYRPQRLLGVDYSEQAIRLAQAMNPSLDYRAMDITAAPLTDRFDVATLVEVLEHIPLDKVDDFLKACDDTLYDNGRVIITVPHVNKPVQAKHYQHFDSGILKQILSPYFDDLVFVPFDSRSKVMSGLLRLIGGNGSHVVVTNRFVLTRFFQLYRSRYLYATDESKCGRIAVVGRKKAKG